MADEYEQFARLHRLEIIWKLPNQMFMTLFENLIWVCSIEMKFWSEIKAVNESCCI